jgi:hypothetical protein
MESYYAWYYHNDPPLMPRFGYTTRKIPAYYYPEAKGVAGTFTESMSFTYLSALDYAVFSFEPTAPAYTVLDNGSFPPHAVVIANPADGYRTIGSMLGFGDIYGIVPPSDQVTLMQKYLEFFNLNVTGPFPLFHAASTAVCKNGHATFTDDSFDNIPSRTWEFPGGEPATSTEANPSVTYTANGNYDVKLTVSDGVHTQTILKKNYIRVEQCSGEREAEAFPAFRIYPNPAGNYIRLLPEPMVRGQVKLLFFDVSGRQLMEKTRSVTPGAAIVVEVSNLPRGMIFLRITYDRGTCLLKFLHD